MELHQLALTSITALKNSAEEHYTETLFAAIGVLSAFVWRTLIYRPVFAGIAYLRSEEYRDRWHISGTYFLYHDPIIVEQQARIRVSVLKIRSSIYGPSAEQSDWKRSNDVNYRGGVEFFGQFIVITMTGVVERYKGIRKIIVLHRTYRQKNSGVNTGGLGKMLGIANDNEIYTIPIVVSKKPLSYSTAEQALKICGSRRRGIIVRTEIREMIEISSAGNSDFHAEQFHSPFS